MASRIESPGTLWATCFGGGLALWLLGVSFAKFIPPSLQFIALALPIGCQIGALYQLPGWRREGRKSDLMENLAEREYVHELQQQHLFNLASRDIDHQMQMDALMDLSGLQPPSDRHPTDSRSLPIASESLSLDQEIMQLAGELGLELHQYLITGRGKQMGDAEGWCRVDRLRAGWGKTRNLNTDSVRNLLNLLGRLVLIEWRDGRMMEFRIVP
jgi:hypothetical protein